MLQLAADWNITMPGRVLVDSTAALGVVKRHGSGRLRHIRVGMLWVQQKQEAGELTYDKVPGQENPGDLMTKHLTDTVICRHMGALGQEWRTERADISLSIAV